MQDIVLVNRMLHQRFCLLAPILCHVQAFFTSFLTLTEVIYIPPELGLAKQ